MSFRIPKKNIEGIIINAGKLRVPLRGSPQWVIRSLRLRYIPIFDGVIV